jgi:hypothetical protein
VGQEVLLFLHGEGATGLTSPVGMAQGVFTLVRRPPGGGPDLAVRGYGPPRAGRLGALPQRALGAGGGDGEGRPPASAVELDALLDAIRHLVQAGK